MEKSTKSSSSSFWEEFIPVSWPFLKKYSLSYFKNDLLAGLTVGVVALPLAMAFAIASGVSPERGIYTTIIAGFLISLLGGSRLQIGGPTGAFIVIIYDIIARLGYDGLVVATLLAAILLLAVALSKLGSLVKYIPYPLIMGFTTGIALVIFTSQVKDFLGLQIDSQPIDFIPKWIAIFGALHTIDLSTLALALATLLFILMVRRFFPIIPWGFSAVVVSTVVVWGFGIPVDSIASRFGEVPRALPLPSFSHFTVSFRDIHQLIPDAITIAFLIGVESLLSAIVADGMAGTMHKSNGELMGQSFANIGSILFGGIPATGAIARTAVNIKTGAKTPIAGMIHAATVLIIVLLFAPAVSQIPLAALSAILMVVAWDMSELHHFKHLFKAPKSDIIVLIATFLLTVLVDLTVAVEGGMILALFLFMKKMGTVSGVMPLLDLEKSLSEEKQPDSLQKIKVPPQVEIYEVTGPLFFGIADSLKYTLSHLEYPPKVFILRMRKVPFIDASGMHALRQFQSKCSREGTTLLLSGVSPSLQKSLQKFGLIDLIGSQNIFSNIDFALSHASNLIK